MRFLWFIPYEYIPYIATLMIMTAGMAFVVQRKAAGISLLITAILLMIAPVFDPAIDGAIDILFNLGDYFYAHASWWVIGIVVLIGLLWLIKAALDFFLEADTAKTAFANIVASVIKTIAKAILFLSPLLLLAWAYFHYGV
jgi:hypothetical protein